MAMNICIDFNKTIGKIKPLHGVGQPPIKAAEGIFSHFHYLTEAGTPYSRLHDVGGLFGGNVFADIPNIFRDFDADENDPSSYDFAFTDALIKALIDAGVEPYYRLGVTIENNAFIKYYHIDPPRDYDKWARICEHIIAHYIDGWADGYHYNITYWEIWNEADDGLRQSQMWNGTAEEYYRLYEVASKHLKGVFGDRIKVGGYAATNLRAEVAPETNKNNPRRLYFVEFFHGFMEYIQRNNAPLDFFSWHSYDDTARTIPVAYWVRKQLDRYGYQNAESHINEWNPVHLERGTGHHSAEVMATLLAMQKAPVDVMAIYDAKCGGGEYCPLFDPYTDKPFHAYYALVAFDHLYELGNEIYTESDTEGVHVVAATDGKRNRMVIANISAFDNIELSIEGADMEGARYHIIDDKRLLSWSPAIKTIEKNQVILIEF
jgi:hypothetical protein